MRIIYIIIPTAHISTDYSVRLQRYLGVVLSDEYLWSHVDHSATLLVHAVDEGALVFRAETEISDFDG